MENIWQGQRIKLRAVEMSDLEDYFCNGEDLHTDDQRTGDRVIFPVSKEKMRERVEMLAKSDPQGEEYFMIIEDKEGQPLGNINSHSCSRIDGTFEYGVSIRSSYRGKGYAAEAITLLLNFYFIELGYQKANVTVYSFNKESIRLHEKYGFVLEGKLRRNHFAKGSWFDVLCFGITKEEFMEKFRV